MTRRVESFGLIVVGNEVLDGRVRDRHVQTARTLAAERGLTLSYALILPDRPDVLEQQFRWAFDRADPFACCGGIGSTPDDCTRACAAAAAGVRIVPHPEGVMILKRRFGPGINAARLRMVEFPEGAGLVPNPVNEVPGFQVRNGFFLPGFPSMAGPMLAWMLDRECAVADRVRCALRLPGAKEGDLVELMEGFLAEIGDVAFSSLPRFTETGTEVVLGLAGAPDPTARARGRLEAVLGEAGILFEPVDPDERSTEG